jgi:hypothetical protein
MTLAKYGVLAFWAYCATCFFVDSNATFFAMGRLLFWATAIAHAAEFAMFVSLFRDADDSLGVHFAKTMTFGLFHIRDVRAQLAGAADT